MLETRFTENGLRFDWSLAFEARITRLDFRIKRGQTSEVRHQRLEIRISLCSIHDKKAINNKQ